MKSIYPANGIIYCTTGCFKSSAVILQGDLIITSGLILLQTPHMVEDLSSVLKCKITNAMQLPNLSQLEHRLVLETGSGQFAERKMHLTYLLHSEAIEQTIKQNFKGLKFIIDGEYKCITEYSTYFSTFLLFQYKGHGMLLQDIRTCFQVLMNNTSNALKTMEDIVCVSTPFGNEHFLNSVHFGHVANLFGKDNCLALLNVSTAFGCEGGGVYDNKLNLRSILLGSTLVHQNDNVCFPLAANISEVFKILFNFNFKKELTSFAMTKSVCMIDSMGCWGTGCLFHMNRRYFVFTCAHVLSSDNIVCYCSGSSLELQLLFKNQIFDSAYDIALLEVSSKSDLDRSNICQLANYSPKIGQLVFSVGFPIFKSCGYSDKFNPTIYRGRVTKYSKGVLYTDCPVQAGQSGGPIFDAEGNLLAVMVSNFKSSMDERTYPRHNMCIPIYDVYGILEKYCKTNDSMMLHKFQANREIANKWKLRRPAMENKL